MPTSATHITIVQRLAADPRYSAVLGNPDPMLPASDPDAIKMRFAALGACGPDFLYALMDYKSDLQDLENILIKTAGTFSALADLTTEIQEFVDGVTATITLGVSDSLRETSDLITAVMSEGLFALLASGGFNPFAYFEPQRQKDRPRTEWYWADVLHYWRTGRFVENLVREAKSTGNPNLVAYAYGYVTHYVTDVVGHPYVNQVVGAPWRLYWQRHHLVENFMDAYVWDRWHTSVPSAPGASEPPLDNLVTAPNAMGTGAPVTYARLNDHINIGGAGLPDPVDALVDDVSAQLRTLLTNIGVAVDTEPDPPTDADFVAWTKLIVRTLHSTYDGFTPTNLTEPFILKETKVSRPDGFPTSDDIAAAYGAFRLLMRVATEEKIVDPMPPAIASDISAAINRIASDVAANLAGIPAPPALPNGGAFSVAAIVAALEKAFEWAAQVAAAITKAVFDFIADTIAAGAIVVADSIKYALWLVSKALYALYRSFRDVLTLRAYANPLNDQLSIDLGGLATASLWQSPGNPVKANPTDPAIYPREEIPEERKLVASSYVPFQVPTASPELPSFDFVAPYAGTTIALPSGGTVTMPALPDAFIEAPLGSDMFDAATGPQAATTVMGVATFAETPKDFGGAVANCTRALDMVMGPTPPVFPDYNLDGDRTYAWPCWDVSPAPAPGVVPGNPLNPDANPPSMVATVNAVELL